MTRAVISMTEHRTTRQASQCLGVSLRTIQLWCEAGTIPFGRTPGRHRRLHVAHLALLEFRMKHALPMPRPSEYAEALLVWKASPAALEPAAATVGNELARSVLDPVWLLQNHQHCRTAAGQPLIRTDDRGNIQSAADVAVHAAFIQGIKFALSYLGALAPTTGTIDGKPTDV